MDDSHSVTRLDVKVQVKPDLFNVESLGAVNIIYVKRIYSPDATATGLTGEPVAPCNLSGRQMKVNS